MTSAMLWPLMALLALCDGQQSTQDEIEVLLETDEKLVKKVQETRQFINGQLIDAIQVLNGKADQNRRQIWQLAEMTQKSLQKFTQKVNQQSHELGRAEDLSEVELPLLGAAVAEGEAIQDHKIQELAQMQQEMDMKVEKMLNRSHHRVKAEIARLKAEVNKTKQPRLPDSPTNKELLAFQQDTWEAVGVEAKKIEEYHSKLSQLIADTDNKMNQLEEAQLLKSQRNEAKIKSLDDRMFENHKSIMLDMQSSYQRIFIQELLFFLFLGMTGTAAHQLLRTWRPMQQTSGLQEPLLMHDTPNSDDSFSVVSVQSVACQPQLFLKRTAISLQEGPPVAAEDLRPNCSVHGAMGGWLEVESVTFKHVQQCDVVQVTLANDAASLRITARQRVVRASTATGNEVILAMELREGDLMLYHGSCFKVQKCECQTLHNAELVEVVFNSEGAVETLADAETEQCNFHIV